MNFHQSFKKCSILTLDIIKQPQTSLESIYFNEIHVHVWPLEGAMYIALWENFRGRPESVSVNVNGWFQTKRFTGLLEPIQLYKQNPLQTFFIFTIHQNYTLALIWQLY